VSVSLRKYWTYTQGSSQGNAASRAPHKKDLFFGETSIFEKKPNFLENFGPFSSEETLYSQVLTYPFQAIFERRNFVLAGSHLSSIAGLCLLTTTSAAPQLAHGGAKYFKGANERLRGSKNILNNNSENFRAAIKIAARYA